MNLDTLRRDVVLALIDGKTIQISFASEDRDTYENLKVVTHYLGKGKYHSYNGTPSNDEKEYHFWQTYGVLKEQYR